MWGVEGLVNFHAKHDRNSSLQGDLGQSKSSVDTVKGSETLRFDIDCSHLVFLSKVSFCLMNVGHQLIIIISKQKLHNSSFFTQLTIF